VHARANVNNKSLSGNLIAGIKLGLFNANIGDSMQTKVLKLYVKKRPTGYCIFLNGCTKKVTNHYFQKICYSKLYVTCHQYAGKLKELNTPMIWLQKMAVEAENKDVNKTHYHMRKSAIK